MPKPWKCNDTEKYCPRCETWKPHAEFYKSKSNPSGMAFACKSCYKLVNKEKHQKYYPINREAVLAGNKKWKDANPEKYKSRPSARGKQRRNYRLLKDYGLTPEEYDRRFNIQRGLCAVCEVNPIEHVDHDHTTGKTRDLLCSQCNKGLGHFNDSPELFRKAADYLEKHQKESNNIVH